MDADTPVVRSAALPKTLVELIDARFSRLSESTRALAETAAIIGDVFDIEILCEVTAWSDERVRAAVEELLDRRLIRDAGIEQRADYAFAHNLIEKAIYSRVSPEARLQRHFRTATVMEDLYAERLEEHANRIAGHFHRSSAPSRAASYYSLSAQGALARHAYHEAAASAANGIAAADDDAIRFELLLLRERANAALGDGQARRIDLDELEAISTADIALPMRIDLLARRIDFYDDAADRNAEASVIRELKTLVEDDHSPSTAVRVLRLEARYHDYVGSYAEARRLLERALAITVECGEIADQIACYCALAKGSERQGDYSRALTYLSSARDLLTDQSEPALHVRVLVETCRVMNDNKSTSELETCSRELLARSESIGERYASAFAHNALGMVSDRRLDTEGASRHYGLAFDYFHGLGHQQGATVVLNNLVACELRVGRWKEAFALAERARTLSSEASLRDNFELATMHAAEAMLRGGQNRRALEFAREALASAQTTGSKVKPFAVGKVGEVLAALGDTDDAIKYLRESADLLQTAGLDVVRASTLAVLALEYARARRSDEALWATAYVEEILGEREGDVEESQRVFWILAQAYRLIGNTDAADSRLRRAHEIYLTALRAVKDPEARRAFKALDFHREIVAAHDTATWPVVVRPNRTTTCEA